MKQLVNRLRYYFRIFYFLAKFSLLDILIFRINALIIGLAPIIWLGTMLIFLGIIFSRIQDLGGWTFWEIVFLTGTHELIFLSTWATFGGNLRSFIQDVKTGRLDQVLLKPANPRFMVSFRSLDFTTFISYLNVIFVFFYSFNKAVVGVDLLRLAGFLALLITAYWIAYLVYFILASLSLFFIDSNTLIDWLFDATDFDRFPAEIYPPSLRIFLTFFLPILFFAYTPTAFLLEKLGWIYVFLGGLMLALLYFISHLIWHSGLKRYQSASS